ncbi:MAG: alpha-amylase family protein [Chryseolinea sp.]
MICKVLTPRLLQYATCVALFFILGSCVKKDAQNIVNQEVPPDSTAVLWYKNGIIYTLDVEVFKDSDNDGVGDFKGLISKLDYIDSLGADVIWLSPFQPTPNKDDGYDISNYYDVDQRLGSLADFKIFVDSAKRRNIKIIIDLVLNHTSDQHPWFLSARKDKNSPFHDWYVWSKQRPKNADQGMVFPGVQQSIWKLDSISHEYYYHRFYDFQPDLNVQNPAVRKEIRKIVAFWMNTGIKGFRVDAVPFVIEVPDTVKENFDHQFEIITALRAQVDSIDKEAVILGEANVMPDENKDYFGHHAEGIQMMFNFYVNQYLFYALATSEIKPLQKALNETNKMPKTAEWGQFLRNHDEVDLGRLTEKQRDKVYKAFGPEKQMQLYDRGIRRRLAPMLGNKKELIELAYSVLLSLPSTPVMRYGDELGMGDDLRLKERLSVRTPMQWDDSKNAGFTSNKNPVLPVIDFGDFTYSKLNVKNELTDSSSLLKWTKKMIMLRKKCPEIAFGTWEILDSGSDHVLVMKYSWQGKSLITIHNFSQEDQQIKIKVDDFADHAPINQVTGNPIEIKNELATTTLKGLEYQWLR